MARPPSQEGCEQLMVSLLVDAMDKPKVLATTEQRI